MGNTFTKKLYQICSFAQTTSMFLAKGLITEGVVENNQRIMRLRYMDALIDLARDRFARNFANAIEGNAETGMIQSPNTSEKLYRLRDYLEEHGMEVEPFMLDAITQAYIVYELSDYGQTFDADQIMGGIYIPFTPDWVIYGMEELYWRYDNGEFIEVNYFDDAEFLVHEYSGMDNELSWNQFALFILGMLDGGTYMPAPEYNHELDENCKEKEAHNIDETLKENLEETRSNLRRFAELIADRLRRGIKL